MRTTNHINETNSPSTLSASSSSSATTAQRESSSSSSSSANLQPTSTVLNMLPLIPTLEQQHALAQNALFVYQQRQRQMQHLYHTAAFSQYQPDPYCFLLPYHQPIHPIPIPPPQNPMQYHGKSIPSTNLAEQVAKQRAAELEEALIEYCKISDIPYSTIKKEVKVNVVPGATDEFFTKNGIVRSEPTKCEHRSFEALKTLTSSQLMQIFKAAEGKNGDKNAQMEMGLCHYFGMDNFPKDYIMALEYIQNSAANGNVCAHGFLGDMYNNGDIPINKSKSFEHFVIAAKAGSSGAQYHLHLHYKVGVNEKIKRDIPQSLIWLQEAANKQYVPAMSCLAGHLYSGDLLPKNEKICYLITARAGYLNDAGALYNIACTLKQHNKRSLALNCLQNAAENGYVSAMMALALEFKQDAISKPSGIPDVKNWYEYWYERAALRGNLEAQFELGKIYENGPSQVEFKMAHDYLLKAAEKGYVPAMVPLAKCYELGKGVPCNPKQAYDWILKAAYLNDNAAQFRIAMYHDEYMLNFKLPEGMAKDTATAVIWYQKAAKDNILAAYNLYLHYYRGEGVDKNVKKALEFLKIAADKNDANCKGNAYSKELASCKETLAGFYVRGEEVAKDLVLAKKLYTEALNLGSITAKTKLEELEKMEKSQFEEYRKKLCRDQNTLIEQLKAHLEELKKDLLKMESSLTVETSIKRNVEAILHHSPTSQSLAKRQKTASNDKDKVEHNAKDNINESSATNFKL